LDDLNHDINKEECDKEDEEKSGEENEKRSVKKSILN
jgi:hypothetical protein